MGMQKTQNGAEITGIPPRNEIVHTEFEFTEAILGTLAWKGNSPTDNVDNDNDALLSSGLHYETSPDVQMIGSLTADVALEFNVDEDGDDDYGIAGQW